MKANKMRIKKLLIKLVLTLFILTAASTVMTEAQESTSLQFSGDEEINIKAGKMIIEQELIIFDQGVTVNFSTQQLKTNKAIIYMKSDNNTKSSSSFSALQGQANIEKIEAEGNVNFNDKEQEVTITGDNGTFLPNKNTILLTGNVVMKKGGTIINGNRLVYDTKTGRMNLTAKDRVSGVFKQKELSPQKSKKN